MCGIAGCWQSEIVEAEELQERVRRMSDALTMRGPDDSGVWTDPAAGLGLGFRRLSILDLSAEGHQPKSSQSGRFVITFNGEIYNYLVLREELAHRGAAFRGHSDTEVILAGFEAWGIEPTLKRLDGMFAIAVWDAQERRLHLARDPFGIKPLYVGMHQGTLFWASELKALRTHPAFQPEIDPDGATLYFRHGYVPGPYSIYRGVRKLEAGSFVSLAGPLAPLAFRRYWPLEAVIEKGLRDPFTGSDEEAVDAVEAALRASVDGHMLSDVPLGAFLSGGIDSSLLVAHMQALSSRPVKTFSIGFGEDTFDETHHAKAVAEHLGTDHAELLVTAQDALDLVPRIPDVYDEPFADPAMIPTYLVSQFARKHVTVTISGDGGDECFGGYYYHVAAHTGRLAQALAKPLPVRRSLAHLLSVASSAAGLVPGRHFAHVSDALGYRARNYGFTDALSYYRGHLADQLVKGESLLAAPRDPLYPLSAARQTFQLQDLAHAFMYLDFQMMLPDEFFTKIDRATASVSLEGRVPFLAKGVVELAWRLPVSYKIRGDQGKWVLRQALKRHVPPEITERPKHGFSVPIGDWLSGPLRGWADEMFDVGSLKKQGLLVPSRVSSCWGEHRRGIREHTHVLWKLLMFQAWHKRWIG